ncbi:unnamed protein product [Pipistrellus nathusii]|uniref:Uncharacterized protein n=1 Tax=Pipistrellus nathusii TaxID=59473 RepID=A0ABN9ZM78_PIPNA
MKSNSLKTLIGNRLGNFYTQIDFGTPDGCLVSPLFPSQKLVHSLHRKVCSTNSGKDALALILSELFQFAPYARDMVIVKCKNKQTKYTHRKTPKCKNEERMQVSSFTVSFVFWGLCLNHG